MGIPRGGGSAPLTHNTDQMDGKADRGGLGQPNVKAELLTDAELGRKGEVKQERKPGGINAMRGSQTDRETLKITGHGGALPGRLSCGKRPVKIRGSGVAQLDYGKGKRAKEEGGLDHYQHTGLFRCPKLRDLIQCLNS